MVGIDTTMKEYKDVIKRTVMCTKTSFYMQCVNERYSLLNIYVSIMSWAVSILFITLSVGLFVIILTWWIYNVKHVCP